MEGVLDVGHILLVVAVLGFLYALFKSLKNEGFFCRFIVLSIIGIIMLTIFLAKGG